MLVNALITVLASGIVLLLEMRGSPATGGSLAGRLRTRVGAFAWLVALVGTLATTTVVFWDTVRAGIS